MLGLIKSIFGCGERKAKFKKVELPHDPYTNIDKIKSLVSVCKKPERARRRLIRLLRQWNLPKAEIGQDEESRDKFWSYVHTYSTRSTLDLYQADIILKSFYQDPEIIPDLCSRRVYKDFVMYYNSLETIEDSSDSSDSMLLDRENMCKMFDQADSDQDNSDQDNYDQDNYDLFEDSDPFADYPDDSDSSEATVPMPDDGLPDKDLPDDCMPDKKGMLALWEQWEEENPGQKLSPGTFDAAVPSGSSSSDPSSSDSSSSEDFAYEDTSIEEMNGISNVNPSNDAMVRFSQDSY